MEQSAAVTSPVHSHKIELFYLGLLVNSFLKCLWSSIRAQQEETEHKRLQFRQKQIYTTRRQEDSHEF